MNSTETPEGTTEPRCDAPPCVACSRTTWHVHLAALSAATPGADEGRCLCDGGSYEVKAHPFLVHPDCPVHRPSPGVVDLRQRIERIVAGLLADGWSPDAPCLRDLRAALADTAGAPRTDAS